MIDFIFLIYQNYRIYILLTITVMCSAVFAYNFLAKKEIGVRKKTVVITLIFLLCCITSYFIYRTPIGYDEVSITVEKNEHYDGTVNVTSVEASNVYYLSFEKIDGNWLKAERGYIYSGNEELSDKIIIRMPHGYERKLYFNIEGFVKSIIIEYENNITYHDAPEGEFYIDLPANRARVYFIEFLIQMFMCVLGGLAITIIITIVIRMKFNTIKKYAEDNIYSIGVFLLLLSDFLMNKQEKIDVWVAPMYALDYSYGFGSRFFIGSILKVIFGDYLTAKDAYIFCEIIMFFTIFILSWMIGKVIKKSNLSNRNAIIFLVLMYICSPGAISSMWTEGNMGRLENHTFLLVLVGVSLFESIKKDWLRYSLLMIISCICLAIYQGYIFLYFPVFFFIVLYDVLGENDIKLKKIIWGLIILITNGIGFIVFQFFTYTKFSSYDEMAAILQQKTDIFMSDSLNFEYFMNVKEAYELITEDFLLSRFSYPREQLFLTICVCLPIFIVMIAIWLKALQIVKSNNKSRILYYIWAISYVAFLPQFVLNVDWGRWCTAIIFYTFFSVLYMKWKENIEISYALGKLQNIIIDNKYVMILILIYLQRFQKFGARNFISSVGYLWENIRVIMF